MNFTQRSAITYGIKLTYSRNLIYFIAHPLLTGSLNCGKFCTRLGQRERNYEHRELKGTIWLRYMSQIKPKRREKC